MNKEENSLENKTAKTNEKAPYRSPRLVTYGDIRELTLNISGTMGQDNATPPNAKTS
jgi:hypothetical protein